MISMFLPQRLTKHIDLVKETKIVAPQALVFYRWAYMTEDMIIGLAMIPGASDPSYFEMDLEEFLAGVEYREMAEL